MPKLNFESKKNAEQDSRIIRLETLFEGIVKDIRCIKKSCDNVIDVLSKRVQGLEQEMAKRWSRPESITVALMTAIITGLIVFLLAR